MKLNLKVAFITMAIISIAYFALMYGLQVNLINSYEKRIQAQDLLIKELLNTKKCS